MGHFSGRLKTAIEDAQKKAKEHAFYDIFKGYGFYDVADPDNGLTDWQRAGVPEYNQHKFTDLTNALSDCIADFLSNDEYGVMTTCLEQTIDKLDARASMTAGEMDSVGGAVGGLTGGAAEGARQAMSALIAACNMMNKFDPDILPPISIGIPGLPISIACCYKPGTFQPDWNFLYDHEVEKNPSFYLKDDAVYIGAGIPLNIGGQASLLILKTIFAVISIDDKGLPHGDLEGGLMPEEFRVVQDALPETTITEAMSEFSLTSAQMRNSFIKYMQLIIWSTIKNPNNYAYLHWGILTHNSCPANIRTAVCSFLRTNGMSIDENTPEAALISYCLNTGMAYLIGRDKPTSLVQLKGMKYIGDTDEVEELMTDTFVADKFKNGVPKDKALAHEHFKVIADVLAHMSCGTSDDQLAMRKRRVAEANLIYDYLGVPKITFGSSVGTLDSSLRGVTIMKGMLPKLNRSVLHVFPNESDVFVDGSGVKIRVDKSADPDGNLLRQRSVDALQYAGAKAGVYKLRITALYKSPEDQGSMMFNNYHIGNIIKYGSAGRQVNRIYTDMAKEHPGPSAHSDSMGNYTTVADDMVDATKQKMIAKVKELTDASNYVSPYNQDPDKVQVIEISMKSMLTDGFSEDQVLRFGQVLNDLWKQGVLASVKWPDGLGGVRTGLGGFRVEVLTAPGKTKAGGMGPTSPVNGGPDVQLNLAATGDNAAMCPTSSDQNINPNLGNFRSATVIDAVLVADRVLIAQG